MEQVDPFDQVGLGSLRSYALEGNLFDFASSRALKALNRALRCPRLGRNKEEACRIIYTKLGLVMENTDVGKMKAERESRAADMKREWDNMRAAEIAREAQEAEERKKQKEAEIDAFLSLTGTDQSMDVLKKTVATIVDCKQKEKSGAEIISGKKRALQEMTSALTSCFNTDKPAMPPNELMETVNKIQKLNEEVASLEEAHAKFKSTVAALHICVQPLVGNVAGGQCGICLEDYDEGAHSRCAMVACGHTFCKTCAPKMTSCAVCRKPSRGNVPLFF